MTRFARAKGSKSSNEKVPEDATPWLHLKKGMLSKQEALSEETKKCVVALKLKTEEEKPTEWVSFDDENDDCLNILKNHLQDRKGIKDNLKYVNDSNERDKKLEETIGERKRKKTENVESQFEKKKKKLKNNCQDNSPAAYKKEKRQKINKEKIGEQVDKVKTSYPNLVQERSFDFEDDVTYRKNNTKKRNASEASDRVETNEEECKGKSKKKREESDQKTEKLLKKKKSKSFAGEKSFKNNSTSFSSKNQSSNTKKYKKLKSTNCDKKKLSSNKNTINIGGEMVDVVKFQGFYIRKEDSERLKELREKMKKEGIPEDQIAGAIKLERRRYEKALARMKKNVCFQCRKPGHLLSQCPEVENNIDTSTGVCYKCGSTEHKAFTCRVTKGKSYPFAECFICKEKGHIARECPDNPRGLYPKGGCCKICGDVTHLKKDCPKRISEAEEKNVKLGLRDDRNVEGLDDFSSLRVEERDLMKQKKKAVRF